MRVGEDREQDNDQTPEGGAEDDIIDVGTEPVGESADPVYNLGTDTVLGSERPGEDTVYMIGRRSYAVIAAAMTGGAVVIGLPGLVGLPRPFGEHTVFALESWEISMFAIYWLIQTIDNWNEKVPAT